ncbi:hypothetical protein GC176_18510 [bacterium]|nr:hypothetical protein [bacterium]
MLTCETIDAIESRISHERVRLVVPTGLEWIDRTVSYLEQRVLLLGVPDPEKIHRITIPLHEAVTNAIIHGNLEVSSELKEDEGRLFSQTVAQRSTEAKYASRTVEIVFDADPHRFQWVITDEGPGFDVTAKLAHADSDEVSLLASGRGITMMRAFMDDVYYHHGGRTVVMTLQRSTEESTCRLDSGNRMRELDRLFSGETNPWAGERATRPVPSQISNPTAQSSQPVSPFDALLDPFLESLLQSADNRHEQRRHQRVPYTAELTVRDVSGATFPAFARDLSRSGISFLCEDRFTSPNVELTLPSPTGPLTLQGEIVRSTRLIPTVTDFGVRFVGNRQAT